MTAVDRPDNGQDEAIRDAMNVLGWSDWAQYEHLSPGHREDVDRVADYVREQATLASARPGAGEQQRVISDIAAKVQSLICGDGSALDGDLEDIHDELLALLSPHTDEETR